jgi:hypothetical protein
MADRLIASRIAVHVQSCPAQRAAARVVELRHPLATNTSLLEEVWFELWPAKGKIPVETAVALVERPLSDAQLQAALRDSRVKVTEATLSHTVLAEPLFEEMLATKSAKSVATVVLDRNPSWPYSEELRLRAARIAGGLHLLETLHELDTPEVTSLLQQWGTWAPRWSARRNWLLAALLERRPELVPLCAASQFVELVSAAAGSRHLNDEKLQHAVVALPTRCTNFEDANSFKFALLRLVNLPACHSSTLQMTSAYTNGRYGYEEVSDAVSRRLADTNRAVLAEPYEAVSDTDVIARLLKRSLPGSNSFRTWTGKPLELEAIAKNPNINAEQAAKIAEALTWWEVATNMIDASSVDQLLHQRFGTALAATNRQSPEEQAGSAFLGNQDNSAVLDVQPEDEVSRVLNSRLFAKGAALFLEAVLTDEAQWTALFGIVDANPNISLLDLQVIAASLA